LPTGVEPIRWRWRRSTPVTCPGRSRQRLSAFSSPPPAGPWWRGDGRVGAARRGHGLVSSLFIFGDSFHGDVSETKRILERIRPAATAPGLVRPRLPGTDRPPSPPQGAPQGGQGVRVTVGASEGWGIPPHDLAGCRQAERRGKGGRGLRPRDGLPRGPPLGRLSPRWQAAVPAPALRAGVPALVMLRIAAGWWPRAGASPDRPRV
jgi:hypothetical protein